MIKQYFIHSCRLERSGLGIGLGGLGYGGIGAYGGLGAGLGGIPQQIRYQEINSVPLGIIGGGKPIIGKLFKFHS